MPKQKVKQWVHGDNHPKEKEWIVIEDSEDDASNVDDGEQGFCARYAVCWNCRARYDTSLNEQGVCRYHPGESIAL